MAEEAVQHPALRFTCLKCTSGFNSKQGLQTHQANPAWCAKLASGEVTRRKFLPKNVTCLGCGKQFVSKSNLTKHHSRCKPVPPAVLLPAQPPVEPTVQAAVQTAAQPVALEGKTALDLAYCLEEIERQKTITAELQEEIRRLQRNSMPKAEATAPEAKEEVAAPEAAAPGGNMPQPEKGSAAASVGNVGSMGNGNVVVNVSNVQHINVYGSENTSMFTVERLRDLTRECADFRELGMKVIEIIYDDVNNRNAFIPNVKLPQNTKVLRGDPKRWELQPTSEVAEHMAKVAAGVLKMVNSHSVPVAIMFDDKMTRFQDARHYVAGNEKKFAEINMAQIRDRLLKNRPSGVAAT